VKNLPWHLLFQLLRFIFLVVFFFLVVFLRGKGKSLQRRRGNNLAHLFLYILRNNKPTAHKTQATKWKWFKAHENYFLGKVQQNNCNVLLDFVFPAGDLYCQVRFHGRGSVVKRPISWKSFLANRAGKFYYWARYLPSHWVGKL